jgi:ATP-binding cassette subfamily F protein uup
MVLGLSGNADARAEAFADYAQWEAWIEDLNNKTPAPSNQPAIAERGARTPALPDNANGPASSGKKKLSYIEAREYSTIERRIADAEEILAQKKAAAEDPAIATDAGRLLSAHADLEAAQKKVDELFARWSELEAKMN